MPAQSIRQAPNPLNLTLKQFQEWAITFAYEDSNGAIINLSGYTPILQFRTSALAKQTVLSLTVGNGLTWQPNANPQVQVSAPINCDPGKYEWDLRLEDGNGSIYLGLGTVEVLANVSR